MTVKRRKIKKAKAPKKKHGRPLIVLTDEQVKTAGDMAGVGCNNDQISAVIGVSPATFDRVLARDKRVFEALKIGRGKAEAKLLGAAYEMAVSGKSPFMTAFWLKCKLGWRENNPDDSNERVFTLNYKE